MTLGLSYANEDMTPTTNTKQKSFGHSVQVVPQRNAGATWAIRRSRPKDGCVWIGLRQSVKQPTSGRRGHVELGSKNFPLDVVRQ